MNVYKAITEMKVGDVFQWAGIYKVRIESIIALEDGTYNVEFRSTQEGTYNPPIVENMRATAKVCVGVEEPAAPATAEPEMNITALIQTAEILMRDNTSTIGAKCARWNAACAEHGGRMFKLYTPRRHAELTHELSAKIGLLALLDDRTDEDGMDPREWSGADIEAAHAEALEMDWVLDGAVWIVANMHDPEVWQQQRPHIRRLAIDVAHGLALDFHDELRLSGESRAMLNAIQNYDEL
ncbi:hypothetical protein [Kosakonia sp. 1610]|uniref:hypothetical protein n=1 Tax=Kosakonia sp. 1610 TaxID=3156426 RepID=UPI003D1DE295